MAFSLAERGEAPRLLVWTSTLLAQLALRLRADREGTALPLRMPGFPWLTVVGLVILAGIFTVGFIGEDSRPELLRMFTLVALLGGGLTEPSEPEDCAC